MGWWITLGVLVLLACLPLGAGGAYGEAGPRAWLVIGPVSWTLYPRKKKKKEKPPRERPEKKAKENASSAAKPKEEKKKGGPVTDFLPLVDVALDFLGDLRRKLRVNRLELNVTLAGDDPCDLAVNYGRACAAVEGLMPQLERLLVIRRREVHIGCDFQADQTRVYARLELTITLGRILGLAIRYGIRVLREYNQIQTKRKGGAVS